VIDVIIPTKNAPESLWLTLTHYWHFAAQDKLLVASTVILDNCSTDPRHAELMRFCQKQDRHQVIRHENDVGVWCSINRGLALSSQRFVMVLTSDVLLGYRVVHQLVRFAEQTGSALVGPDTLIGMKEIAWLCQANGDIDQVVVDQRYNGSVWLMDWDRLKVDVGWYDPQFYVSFGDTDYIERLYQKAQETGDPTCWPAVIRGLWTCHLDKQTRRSEMTSEWDSEMELRDGARFREKWKDHLEVLQKHPPSNKMDYIQWKERNLGGWDAARVR